MSLRVWLPLTKDLRNQGLDDVAITNNGATFNSTGKLGGSYTGRIDVSSSIIPTILNGSEFTVAFWIYINEVPTGSSAADTYVMVCGTSGTRAQFHIAIRQNGAGFAFCFYADDYTFYNTVTDKVGKWMHVVCAFKNNTQIVYVDGTKVGERATAGGLNVAANSILHIYAAHERLNDVRIYDHCLSPMEVKELSKGLVLHYPLNRGGWGQENLFIDSTYEQADSSIANSSTDWSKYFRRYNGSAGIHSFSDYTDTVTLSTTGNLGVTFQRKATDINLDSTSYYTISCEAKSTQTARPLCIGLSYYNNSNSWVWRGGSNPTYFEEVNKWQKFTLTFKPDADTQYIDYCFTVTGVAGGTDTFSIRHCKLEKGSIATPWCPNSSDTLADEMGLNETTEYDCSGYCNNSTYNSKPVVTSDTPKYNVSTHFGAYNTPKTDINDTSILSSLTNCSIAWWAKTELVKTLFFTGQDGSHYVMASNNNNFYHQNAGSPTIYRDGVAGVYKNEAGVWHHYVMTGVNLSSWTQFRINSYSSWPLNGLISDVRIYATALSADDVKSLYQNCAYIDSDGNVYGAVHSEV